MFSPQTPLIGIAPWVKKIEPALGRLGLRTVFDLLFYYPSRYDDLSKITKIVDLKVGFFGTVLGQVQFLQSKRSRFRRKLITEMLVKDDTGSARALWFNQPYVARILKPGDWVYLSGKLGSQHGGLEFISPAYERLSRRKQEEGMTHTARIVPVYHLTEKITQKQIRYLLRTSLSVIKNIIDPLPMEILLREKFLPIAQALKNIHFPTDFTLLERARKRFQFEELFFIQLKISQLKRRLSLSHSLPIRFFEKETRGFVKNLPFRLTSDQRKAAWEILQDIAKPRTMNRLLEGDVGSGKTVVAAMAMLNAAINGYQSAFLAPTEVLAKQHFATLAKLFLYFPTPIQIALLTRSYHERSSDAKISSRALKDEIASGKIPIIVGTHALLSQDVSFHSLALSIIDEQHRFGVSQRKALREKCGDKNYLPHLLSLTATPIPRTLYLAFYSDLSLSLIKEFPKGRKKIITRMVEEKEKAEVYEFIRQEIQNRRQVFVICPLIDPSDTLGVKSVTQEYEKLNEKIFPEIPVGLLHGRLKTKEKEEVMRQFVSGETKILVSTSIVEVGVDIPNASVMMIEGAERFGLSQIHQFRGRVGRSEHQSYCFLFLASENECIREDAELSEPPPSSAKKRLEALVSSSSGFELAKKDLELRGAGEIYGQKQSGLPSLKIADISDVDLIKKAQFWAEKTIAGDPDLVRYPLLVERIQHLSPETHLE